jgi:hypothetical protein
MGIICASAGEWGEELDCTKLEILTKELNNIQHEKDYFKQVVTRLVSEEEVIKLKIEVEKDNLHQIMIVNEFKKKENK